MLRRLLRRRSVSVVTLGALGLLLSVTLSQRIAAIEAERSAWGTTADVVVVTDEIQAGQALAGAVELRTRPEAVVPPHALRQLPSGGVAKVGLHPGDILIAPRVAALESGFGVGDRAVAVTLRITARVPLMDVGDLVDLWTVDSAQLASTQIAKRVVILAVPDDDITVAIPPGDVGQVAVASLRPVTVALVG